MSCGDPHETDCAEVIERVDLYLDGEIDDRKRTRIQVHPDECAPWLRQYGREQEVKVLVTRSGGADPAPTRLRTQVLTRLQPVRLEINLVKFRAD